MKRQEEYTRSDLINRRRRRRMKDGGEKRRQICIVRMYTLGRIGFVNYGRAAGSVMKEGGFFLKMK